VKVGFKKNFTFPNGLTGERKLWERISSLGSLTLGNLFEDYFYHFAEEGIKEPHPLI